MRRPLEAEGLPRGALPGEGFPEGFTFPGALAAARWGLPGLGGTGEGREQRHGPAAGPSCPPELPSGAEGQDGGAAPGLLGRVVRLPRLPKWRPGRCGC